LCKFASINLRQLFEHRVSELNAICAAQMRELRAQLNARVLEAKRESEIFSPASRYQAFGYSHTSPHDSFAEEVNISPRDFIRRIHFYVSLTSIFFLQYRFNRIAADS
jgi:hypothetical protein